MYFKLSMDKENLKYCNQDYPIDGLALLLLYLTDTQNIGGWHQDINSLSANHTLMWFQLFKS